MGFTGPEGAGKSVLMTAFCLAHVKLGGKLLTFPGYQVTDGKGKILSTEIPIQDWIGLPEELNNAVIAIDEMQNFFDSYRYNAALANIFVGLQAQRRKRNLAILFTVQDYLWLPPRMRQLIHILAPCWDLYWAFRNSDEAIKRGEKISVSYIDCKGFYTGYPWQSSAPFTFHAQKYWPFYDSWTVVDIWNKFTKVKVKAPEIKVDLTRSSDEPPIPPGFQPTDETQATGADMVALAMELAKKGHAPGEIQRLTKQIG